MQVFFVHDHTHTKTSFWSPTACASSYHLNWSLLKSLILCVSLIIFKCQHLSCSCPHDVAYWVSRWISIVLLNVHLKEIILMTRLIMNDEMIPLSWFYFLVYLYTCQCEGYMLIIDLRVVLYWMFGNYGQEPMRLKYIISMLMCLMKCWWETVFQPTKCRGNSAEFLQNF